MIQGISLTIRFALQNLGRNLWLTLITLFMLILTLSMVSIVLVMNIVGGQAIRAVEEKVDINIFFPNSVAESTLQSARSFISELPEVKGVEYISPEQALQAFRENHLEDKNIQEALDELEKNPLPATLVVQARDIASYPNILQAFEASEWNSLASKTDFNDHRVLVEKLQQVSRAASRVGIALSMLFMIISALAIFNTIRLAIYSHREEITIMKLVGATNGFIRWPFIIEGLVYASLASLTTIALLWIFVQALYPSMNNFFMGYNFDLRFYFYEYFWQIFLAELVVALFLSITSAMIAITKYLKV